MPRMAVCRLPNGLDIGGFVLKGNYAGPDHPVDAPGRERVAGFEVTRDVPDDAWRRWPARAQFEAVGAVYGGDDEQAVAEWCWRNARPHGHAHGAPQSGPDGSPLPGPPPVGRGAR